MKLKVALPLFILLGSTAGYVAAEVPDFNKDVVANLTIIQGDSKVRALVSEYETMDNQDDIFKEHLEIARIASPSRQEYYRAKELYDRLLVKDPNAPKADEFQPDELVFTGAEGTMKGAAVQQVDGLRVYQTCAIIKGSWNGMTDGSTGVWSRPKVVIEGHIDTVNPSTIPDFNADMPKTTPLPWHFEPVKLQPVWDSNTNKLVPLVSDKKELEALPISLAFTPDRKVDLSDGNYELVLTGGSTPARYSSFGTTWTNDADKRKAYRIYVPGYSDAIGNTIHVYTLAKLFKKHQIQPVYDIWFCFTAGEEGRGNLAGMKQLYGYNQQNAAADPKDNGRNTLNIVANLSIDGGTLTFSYLGSYRYEVNYKGVNGALEAARSIAAIADVKSPWDEDTANPKTVDRSTYTVGTAYMKADGSTSFEIDMRSPTSTSLNVMRDRLYPLFGSQTGQVKVRNGVQIQELWFGDRPAKEVDMAAAKKDPLIYAAWFTYEDLGLYVPSSGQPSTFQLPTGSSSVNDNIPAAMGIPTVNLNIGTTADGGGGHAFNEWAIRGQSNLESRRMQRVLRTLLVLSGVTDSNRIPGSDADNPAVVPIYSEKAPQHTDKVWDAEDYWQTH